MMNTRVDVDRAIDKALRSELPLARLRLLVQDLMANGWSREEIADELECMRIVLQDAGREHDEDIILEVLDFLEGWCSPHMRL